MITGLVVLAVVAVGVMYAAYKWPTLFGIASKAVGETVDAGVDKAKDAIDQAKK